MNVYLAFTRLKRLLASSLSCGIERSTEKPLNRDGVLCRAIAKLDIKSDIRTLLNVASKAMVFLYLAFN